MSATHPVTIKIYGEVGSSGAAGAVGGALSKSSIDSVGSPDESIICVLSDPSRLVSVLIIARIDVETDRSVVLEDMVVGIINFGVLEFEDSVPVGTAVACAIKSSELFTIVLISFTFKRASSK